MKLDDLCCDCRWNVQYVSKFDPKFPKVEYCLVMIAQKSTLPWISSAKASSTF